MNLRHTLSQLDKPTEDSLRSSPQQRLLGRARGESTIGRRELEALGLCWVRRPTGTTRVDGGGKDARNWLFPLPSVSPRGRVLKTIECECIKAWVNSSQYSLLNSHGGIPWSRKTWLDGSWQMQYSSKVFKET